MTTILCWRTLIEIPTLEFLTLTYCPNWNVWTAAKGAKMCWYFSIQSNDSVERDDFDSSLWAIPHNILCPNSDLTLTNRSFIMIKFPPQTQISISAQIIYCDGSNCTLRTKTSEKTYFVILRYLSTSMYLLSFSWENSKSRKYVRNTHLDLLTFQKSSRLLEEMIINYD